MNDASLKRLEAVHPELARRVAVMAAALAKRGIQIEVVQGLRTWAEQDALFAQGRTKPGNVVTRARGGQSNHNYGTACDVCPVVNGKLDWNARESVWQIIGQEAIRAGLEWGGNWKKFPDRPHVQLPLGLSVKACQKLYKQGKLKAVWHEADRILGLSTAPVFTAALADGKAFSLSASALTAATVSQPHLDQPADPDAANWMDDLADQVPASSVKDVSKKAAARVGFKIARPLGLLWAALEAGNVYAWLGVAVLIIGLAVLIYLHRRDIKRIFAKLFRKGVSA